MSEYYVPSDLTEKEIEDFLWCFLRDTENSIPPPGIDVQFIRQSVFIRQMDLGSYGRADIVQVSITGRHADIFIWELKKGGISIDTLAQAARYATGIERMIISDGVIDVDSYRFYFILIGTFISQAERFKHLCTFSDMVTCYEYRFHDEYGVVFNRIALNNKNELRGSLTKKVREELSNLINDQRGKLI